MALTAGVAQASGLALDAAIGYGGAMVGGHETPLRVTVTNGTEQPLRAELAVDVVKRYAAYDTLALPIALEAGETGTYTLPVLPLFPQRTFDVTLSRDGELLAFTSANVRELVDASALAVGVLGGEELADALAVRRGDDVLGREEIVSPVLLDAETFPESRAALDAFPLLVIDGFDAAALNDAQRAALFGWLGGGGTLLLGAGKGEEQAFAAQTGVRALGELQTLDVIGALRDSVGLTQTSAPSIHTRLLAGGEPLVQTEAGAVAVRAAVGDGLVLVCGFSLSDPALLAAAREESIWRRVLLAADATRYNGWLSGESAANYENNPQLNLVTRVSEGKGIVPLACLLAGYVLLVGAGLYALMRRRDQSGRLWAVIPLTALLAVAAVALYGRWSGLGAPAAAQTTIVHCGTDGAMRSEELVHIGMATQSRVTVTGAQNEPIERMSGNHYSGYAEQETCALRDRVTLGDAPAIELQGAPTWLARDLVIHSGRVPQGTLDATVYLAADGVHAEIANGTDAALHEAVLLTPFGCAILGDLPAGGRAEAFLPRADAVRTNSRGDTCITPGEAQLYPFGLYRIAEALVYPERETNEPFGLSMLSEAERVRREMLSARLGLAHPDGSLPCALVALCPDVACTQLLIDGVPVTRAAQQTVLIREIAWQTEAPDGYTLTADIPAHRAEIGEDGAPRMGETATQENARRGDDACFGYDLSALSDRQIEAIRVTSLIGAAQSHGMLRVYDYERSVWCALDGVNRATIGAQEAAQAIGPEGNLFLRVQTGGYVPPDVMVEGRMRR